MAHQADDNVIETVVQLLCENGLSHMADAMRVMLNEAMRIERSQALEADPYQRTERRRGCLRPDQALLGSCDRQGRS